MPERLALKRLTRSDLTLFETKYRMIGAGNQKAINLNADVFISDLYPLAPTIAPGQDNEIRLALSILGPDGKPEDRMTRKIIKNPTYKNWRLNGEFISNPEDDPTRYDTLQPDDLAIMSFDGEPVPTTLKLCLISQTGAADAALHAELFGLLGNRSMIPITSEILLGAADRASTAPDHPARAFTSDLVIEAAVEDAALGGEAGVRTLRSRGRRLSAADLAKARANASAVGRDGEGLVNALFQEMISSGQLNAAVWVADSNAISPYDFRLTLPSSEIINVDVKSTSGPFENEIHISMAEIIEAATRPEQYDIYRVFELNDDGGKLRIAHGIGEFAKTVITALDALPAAVRCDSFSVNVAALTWEPETYVARPSGEEESSEIILPPQVGAAAGSLPANSP